MRWLLPFLVLTFLLPVPARAGEEEESSQQAPAPEAPSEEAVEEPPSTGLVVKDVDVKMEKVEKVKRRLQGSHIVRDHVVVGWNWEVEVSLERTPEAESGRWIVSGDVFDKLKAASQRVSDWHWGKKSKLRVRIVAQGYLPADKGDILSSVPLMAARTLRDDIQIAPPPEPKPEPEPEPEPEATPPAPEPVREKPKPKRSNPQDPRLSRKESIDLVASWAKEREDIKTRIARYRTVIKGAEGQGHEDKTKQATRLLDGAAKALEDSTGPYLACQALVDAGERVLLRLRLEVNTQHFKAERDLLSVDELLLVFTGPGSGGGTDDGGGDQGGGTGEGG